MYLAHGKDERKKGKEIQAEIEKLGIEVFNPFYSVIRDDIIRLDTGMFSDDKEKGKAMIVVDSDLEGIRKSDMIICIYPKSGRTYGVPCEMMYASMLNMPIISVGSEDVLSHPWILALSDGLFSSVDELYLYLKTICESDEKIDELLAELAEKGEDEN